jgi:fluoroacetyl-CoA thioesterase
MANASDASDLVRSLAPAFAARLTVERPTPAEVILTVDIDDADTAEALLSGDVPVLATPRLVAWMELAARVALEPHLVEGETSVGAHIEVHHLAPSPVGSTIEVRATMGTRDGRSVAFTVAAGDRATGVLLARGTHARVVVARDRFLARLTG